MELAIALSSALIAFSHASAEAGRGTGRTTRMVKAAEEGDFIVVPSDGCARHIQRLIEEVHGVNRAKPKVTVIVAAPTLHRLAEVIERRVTSRRERGKVHIDHFWVEQFIVRRLQDDIKQIQGFSQEVLGRPAPEPVDAGFGMLRHKRGFGS